MLRIVFGVAVAVMICSRLIFDGLNFVPAAKCVLNSRTVEDCSSKNLLPQHVSNMVNIIGAYLETINSLFLFLMLFVWNRFHPIKFLFALLKVGHFWLWFALCSSVIITVLQVDITKGQTDGKPDDLGCGLILEAISLTLFASALNFISRDTIRDYFEQTYTNSKWPGFFILIYNGVLASYFVRNFGLFLYDTALLAMSISQTSKYHDKSKNREWDSVLLVFSCAFRGCLFRFFFSKIFQGCNPPQVCDNIEVEELGRLRNTADDEESPQASSSWMYTQ